LLIVTLLSQKHDLMFNTNFNLFWGWHSSSCTYLVRTDHQLRIILLQSPPGCFAKIWWSKQKPTVWKTFKFRFNSKNLIDFLQSFSSSSGHAKLLRNHYKWKKATLTQVSGRYSEWKSLYEASPDWNNGIHKVKCLSPSLKKQPQQKRQCMCSQLKWPWMKKPRFGNGI
jgi:hypothetical protein